MKAAPHHGSASNGAAQAPGSPPQGPIGENLSLPALASLDTPGTIQLRRDGGVCSGASFTSPKTATLFEAKSD